MKIVSVEWEDACSAEGWVEGATELEPVTCMTVGFLIRRDKKAIHLAGTVTDAAQSGQAGTWRIPAGMIRKVKTLATLKGQE